MRIFDAKLLNRSAWYVLENVSPLVNIKIIVDGRTSMPLSGSPWKIEALRAVAVVGLPSRV